jgi:hypothetical protein
MGITKNKITKKQQEKQVVEIHIYIHQDQQVITYKPEPYTNPCLPPYTFS